MMGARRGRRKLLPKVQPPRLKGIGVVRDKHGKPKIDDPDNITPALMMALTEKDRKHLGLWSGALVRDADGVKRATLVADGKVRLEEPARAAAEVSIDGKVQRFSPRVDVPAGGTITWRA